MKVGDLVKCKSIVCIKNTSCSCWFCEHKSTGIGIICEEINKSLPETGGYWCVMFDAGDWRLYGKELEVISELL